MEHQSYEAEKKTVFKGLLVLGIITLSEVFIALLGYGFIISEFELPKVIMYPAMISLSLYKAYFIVFYFMHMAYEVPALRLTVLLPTCLLLWAIIAFFHEGDSWGNRRHQIQEKNKEKIKDTGSLFYDEEHTKFLI